MTQADRDRLVTLKKVKKKLITQREAAEELDLSVRHVKRLLKEMKRRGDKAVIHGLRGRSSPRKIGTEIQKRAMEILSADVYRGFGPTLASEYLAKQHEIPVSRETVRQWMMEAGLWRAHRQKITEVQQWRRRRSRCGELVQWDTSNHDWLEGRGKRMYLIAMIDDATSRMYARFVVSDSTEENMRTLEGYLRLYGRPLAFYTDKAGLFRTAEKRRRDEPGIDKDPVEMPPTQIGRALRELEIVWIPAHSPQAKGRVERGFQTAQDRLIKGMRVAKVNTLEQANRYLAAEFLAWWNQTLTVAAANTEDAHRELHTHHNLTGILSHVETRQVSNDYTIQFDSQRYQIQRESIRTGLRGSGVRVEKRLDGSVAARFGEDYLELTLCSSAASVARPAKPGPAARPRTGPNAGGQSQWMKHFGQQPGPPLWKVLQEIDASEEPEAKRSAGPTTPGRRRV